MGAHLEQLAGQEEAQQGVPPGSVGAAAIQLQNVPLGVVTQLGPRVCQPPADYVLPVYGYEAVPNPPSTMEELKAAILAAPSGPSGPGAVTRILASASFLPRPAGFTSLMQAAAKQKQTDKVLELFQSMQASLSFGQARATGRSCSGSGLASGAPTEASGPLCCPRLPPSPDGGRHHAQHVQLLHPDQRTRQGGPLAAGGAVRASQPPGCSGLIRAPGAVTAAAATHTTGRSTCRTTSHRSTLFLAGRYFTELQARAAGDATFAPNTVSWAALISGGHRRPAPRLSVHGPPVLSLADRSVPK